MTIRIWNGKQYTLIHTAKTKSALDYYIPSGMSQVFYRRIYRRKNHRWELYSRR